MPTDKVIVTKSKLDAIANITATKTDIQLPISLDELVDAIADLVHRHKLLSLIQDTKRYRKFV